MGTSFRGTFVISWSQTEVDGQKAATLQALMSGSVWSWRGEAVRVEGPHGVLNLTGATGEEDTRACGKSRTSVGGRRRIGDGGTDPEC